MRKLDSRIVKVLAEKTGRQGSTVKKDIYLLARKFSACTKNAVAQIYAMERGHSVLKLLDKEDRASMPNLSVEEPVTLKKKEGVQRRRKDRIVQFLCTRSTEFYKVDHIAEINRAYTYRCFTSCFVLCRKVVENLIVDVLRAKYPPNVAGNLELYFNSAQGRYCDFSVLLRNLGDRSGEFGPDAKLVERIIALATPFKKESNDRAHSWYYIVKNRSELDGMNVQDIVDLLEQLLTSVSVD